MRLGSRGRARARVATRTAVLALLLLLVAAAIAQPVQSQGKPGGQDDPGAPEAQGRPDDAGAPDDAGQGQGHGPQAESGATNASPGPNSAPSPQSSGTPSDAPAANAASEEEVASPPAVPGSSGLGQDQSPPSRPSPPSSTPAEEPAQGAGAAGPPESSTAADAATPASPRPGLQVARVAKGNLLEWQASNAMQGAAAVVEVQRQVGDDWVTVASVPADAGAFVDAGAPSDAVYRLAWTSQVAVPLGPDALDGPLATLAPGLVQDGGTGVWLAGLLWGAIAAIATVRSPNQPSVQESRVTMDQLLLSALAGLPGIDPSLVQRVQGMGLRTVGQLRAIDAEALAFWTNLPAPLFRRWQEAVDMLQWPLLPAGAAQRLAMAGAGSLAEVAAADPRALYEELHAGPGFATVGPGLPDDPDQVEVWVTEAKKAVRGAGRLAGANGLRGRSPA